MSKAIYNDGTWAWASEMLLAGGELRMKRWVEGCSVKMLGDETEFACCIWVHKDGIPNKPFGICESHLRATDWETIR